MFDVAEVRRALLGGPFEGCLHHVATTASTNALGVEAAQAGAGRDGMERGVWVADEQTAGRGRGGHGWHSAAGDGLYVSVLLRPRLGGADVLKVSLAAGLAAKAAVVSVAAGADVDIRWPNDLLLREAGGRERKFGGILTEAAMEGGEGRVAYAVVGIGMNLNHAAMPEELREIAASVRMVTGRSVQREELLPVLLRGLWDEVAALEQEAAGTWAMGRESLAVRFERASTWVRGAQVRVEEDDGYTGVTDGVDAHGLLRVRTEDGQVRTVRHGGVRRA